MASMAHRRDHYAVLGVPQTASAAAIRTAYRRLALCVHPDRAGAASATAFREIAAAYEVLGDSVRREKYDAQLAHERRAAVPVASSTSGVRTRQLIARLSGPLRSLLAAGLLRTVGEDAYEVWLTADEAAAGGYFSISTSPPNQLLHWISVAAGIADGTVLTSRLNVAGMESTMRLRMRVY
jgi:curved DNA-binding protein CbpA